MEKKKFIEDNLEKYPEGEENSEELEYVKGDSSTGVEDDIRGFEDMKKVIRERGYLKKLELESICKFKYSGNTHCEDNKEEKVKRVTREVLNSDSGDEAKVKRLSDLDGVRTPTASAILTVVYPERYAIIDYRAIRSLLWKFSDLDEVQEFYPGLDAFQNREPKHYPWYMEKVRSLAEETGRTPREIDMALWAFDKQKEKSVLKDPGA